jgi:hypothetical protein
MTIALTSNMVHALLYCLIGIQDGGVLMEREPGSDHGWLEVLPIAPGGPRYAIWKKTGAVHTIGADGAVSDDPVWLP